MDFSSYRTSHGDDEPSGENLEYDPAFISLELAAQSSDEQQFGDSITPASGPDHKEVMAHAKEVLSRSHDLRAAIFLAPTLLALEGLKGFADCTAFIRWMLDEYWDTCHPQLDADDDDDPTMRVNAVVALADPDNVLRAIRQAQLTESRAFGRFSLRDIMIAEGDMAPPSGMDNPPEASAINGAFQDTSEEWLAGLMAAVDSALGDVRAISAVFDDKVPGRGPELDPLIRILRQIKEKFSSYGVAGEAEQADEDAAEDGGAGDGEGFAGGGASAPAGGRAPGPVSAPGAINGPQDVRNTIDRLIAYYQRAEPSSPVPLILARAKRLVGTDFVSIIKDMAPDGKDMVYMIAGLKDEDEDD
ncbi:MAG: type VI secretion system protein TssA [Paracoccaceae bacterium]|nr:MAG: type VI secretion system protein TssA [Paracoccaceae bacterium]